MDTLQLQNELDNIKQDVENSINELTGIITNAYSRFQKDYLNFIQSDTVAIDELIEVLNNLRLLHKLCIDSEHISPSENTVKTKNDFNNFSKDALLARVQKAAETTQKAVQRSKSISDKAVDIEDDDEFDQIQHNVRKLRKNLRGYESLCADYIKTIEQFSPLVLSTIEANPVENKTIISEMKENESASAATAENEFRKWLTCNVSQEKAEQYISNLHSIENLYKKVFKTSITLLPVGLKNELIGIIRMLNCNNEFLDADERRNYEFSQTLDKLAEFAGIETNKTPQNNTAIPAQSEGNNTTSDVEKAFGAVPVNFVLNGNMHIVSNWKDLYMKFISVLYYSREYNNLIKSLREKRLVGRKIDFADKDHTYMLEKEIKIAPNFFIESYFSPKEIISRINSVLNICSIAPGNMIINYSSVSETDKHPSDNKANEKNISDVTQTASEKETNTDSFKPDTTKPFDLKKAILEILSSNTPEINHYRVHKNGINIKKFTDIVKLYYWQNIDYPEIIDSMMNLVKENKVIAVGQNCFIINEEIEDIFSDCPDEPADAETSVVGFDPDLTKPFNLKEAIIEIMTSDSPEIIEKRGLNGGFNNKIIHEILKKYYKQDISKFEIIKMLMTEDIFLDLGRLYFVADKTQLPDNKPDVAPVLVSDITSEPDLLIQTSPVPESPDNSDTSSEITEVCEANEADSVPEVSSAPEIVIQPEKDSEKTAVSDEAKLMNEILSVIKDNSDSLEYRDGFGAYEVKTLLAKKDITGIDEDDIELMMLESNDLNEVEDGYFIYTGETEKTFGESVQAIQIRSDPQEIIQTDDISAKSDNASSGIKLRLNGRTEDTFDISDALIKIYEFSISCKPFAMARIAKSDIALNGKKVFCRQPAPISGYEKLSNGLQVMRINSMSELETITEKVMKYCNIGNDMIEIIK